MNQNLLGHRTVAVLGLAWALGCSPLSAQQPTGPAEVDFGDAVLRDWVQPQYPADAAKAKLEGQVSVEFIVEPEGGVTEAKVKKASDPQFAEAALAAVRQWKFQPAVEDGKVVRSALGARVEFKLTQLNQKRVPISPPDHLRPHSLKPTVAKTKFAPDPDYPAELEERRLPGVVNMEFTVSPAGRAEEPRVRWASHPAFVESALRAMEKWEFEPARQGPLPKASKMAAPVEFVSVGAKRAEILTANHLVVESEPAPATPPQPRVLIEPVYPFDRLMTGESGSAAAEFKVDERGMVSEERLVNCTHPDFGAALIAAVESWAFEPARAEDGPVTVWLRVQHEYILPTNGADARLLSALQPGGPGVSTAGGLDQRLQPLWRGFPVYPAALREQKTAGQAEIEFIIDRDGRARFPRVKNASQKEFGWAAATAISQWVFHRPRRQGEPIDVRVSIPVNFPLPES